MQQPAADTGMRSVQRDTVRIHPDGGTVITARMPTPGERPRFHPPGAPVLEVTWPNGRTDVFPGALSLVVGDAEATASAGQDAARYVIGTVTEDLENIRSTLHDLADAIGRSPGSAATLAAEIRDQRIQEWDLDRTGSWH
jgi:hypothetical protein